jgi:hypothetical protein
MYSSYSFSTSALNGGEWSALRPSRALVPGKGPSVPIVQEAGCAPEAVWTQRLEKKSFSLCRGSNLDRPYTAWATRSQQGQYQRLFVFWNNNHPLVTTTHLNELLILEFCERLSLRPHIADDEGRAQDMHERRVWEIWEQNSCKTLVGRRVWT